VVELHHADQLWWPELGLTKRDAWEYYDAIAPTVLPHLRDRHVRVPISRRHTYDEVRDFARVIAGTLARVGVRDVKLDVKMNGHGQQIVAPYSIRPLPTAAVATPLAWDEVGDALDPVAFTPNAVLERVSRGGDLAAPLLRGRQSIKRLV